MIYDDDPVEPIEADDEGQEEAKQIAEEFYRRNGAAFDDPNGGDD